MGNNIPFDIDTIPTKELRRQYIDYSIQLPITQYTNVFESANIEPIEPILTYIKGKYMLKDWQCYVGYAHNDIEVALIIPNINQNVQIISDEMYNMGYFIGGRQEKKIDGMTWVQIQFEPLETTSITDEIREEGILYHVTHSFNKDSIKSHGIQPHNEDNVNNIQNYYSNRPNMVFLLRGYTELQQWRYIANSLNSRRPITLKTNDFSVFKVDVSKLPEDIEFYGDPQHPSGVCTTSIIPSNAIDLVSEFRLK